MICSPDSRTSLVLRRSQGVSAPKLADTSQCRLRRAKTCPETFDRCRRFDSPRGQALSFVRPESKTSVQAVINCLSFPENVWLWASSLTANGNYLYISIKRTERPEEESLPWFCRLRLAIKVLPSNVRTDGGSGGTADERLGTLAVILGATESRNRLSTMAAGVKQCQYRTSRRATAANTARIPPVGTVTESSVMNPGA